ncbi:hypothetical protein QC762_0083020 [Podospora pseudocomata]|uniref:Fe2OG dioxygenase domain-containing protein n=1 Tax=Podospora pseudocomata TaxID=2093779 RepID=A0ABR0GC97_9PEZI|nr:hypothetical protein QC762_0083020 [Podospora pseudocomata]
MSPPEYLHLASPLGPISRPLLPHPPRDALPSEIPIINLTPLFSDDLPSRQHLASQIRQAATTSGFMYISHHGIPLSLFLTARNASLDWFRSPLEAKLPANTNNSLKNKGVVGYRPRQTQHINPWESVDVRESFSWRYDPAYDPLHSPSDLENIPDEVKRYIDHDNDGFPWSRTPKEFSGPVIELYQAVLKLGRELVRVMALALGLEEDGLDGRFEFPDVGVAVNYYPPIAATKDEGKEKVSIGSHTDFQLFTLLYQDSVGGLQVLDREGQWLNARPVEGTLVVNFGDYMQRITNGKWVSTVHRVVNNSGRERLSMAFFWGFGLHERCGVLDSVLEEGEEKKYDEVGCWEWVQRRIEMMREVKKGLGNITPEKPLSMHSQ